MRTITKNQRMVRTAMLAAITLVLALTPLGYIPLPILPLTVTIMVAPVALGGLTLGWPTGLALSLIFGLSSFFRAPFEPLGQIMLAQSGLLTFLATVVPRVGVGLLADASHKLAAKQPKLQKFWYYTVTGLACSLCNTVLFLGFLWLVFDNAVTGVTLTLLGSLIITAGIPEAIVNAILVGTIAKAMLYKKQSKNASDEK